MHQSILMEDGIKEGKIEGRTEGKSEILIIQLTQKFIMIPKDYEENIKTLPEKTIDEIATNIFSLEKIDDLKKYF